MGDPRPIGTFCWSELGTSDTDGARAFYGKLFGWQTVDQDMPGMGTYTLLRLGEDDLGGMYALEGPMFEGVPPHWTFYVSVEDVAATVSRVPELGGEVVMPPMEIPGKGHMALLTDPTGARFAIFEGTGHHGATVEPMTPGGFGWVELNTRDPQAARAFYTALFGWEARTDEGPMPYTEWSLPGAGPFGGMMKMDEHQGDAPPCWLGYVMVEDCDGTFAKASDLGARPIVPPMTIEGVGRFAVIADPQGAVFSFIKLFPHPSGA